MDPLESSPAMPRRVLKWLDLPRVRPRLGGEGRKPLILVNGLAEQSESWFANERSLGRRFDVKLPEILVYGGDALHRWIDAGHDVTVGYLARRLESYLDEFVQRPPYHFAASSLGCQVVLTYAVANPGKVDRLVLICPSGFHGDENLPMIDGVRRSRYDSLVGSVFHEARFADERLVGAFERKFQDRRWKKGVLRTLRGTVGHSVEHLLHRVDVPTLLIWGAEDQVISDVPGSIRAGSRIPDVRQVVIPRCGHAPQIEKSRLVNQLIDRFLIDRLHALPRALDVGRFLNAAAGTSATPRLAATSPALPS
ncbi:alpha/beta fold hydrolase [Paludisphaera soli]|uniref:alpha/beta fold hydrolase n=1 Tax=Paludisphaera soli TaxID=2712865 RepID=UPI001F0DD9A1|nr:alpha/beta hydrolase [Paludisphaera soli]